MCEPITATAAVLGGAQLVGGTMQAVGQHQAQQAAVARSNAIARQEYQQQLQINAARDASEDRIYQSRLKEQEAAQNAYYRQLSANQAEANRAMTASQQKMQERATAGAFSAERAMIAAIKAQGQTLSTGKAGQSFLLQAMDAQRTLGFEQAQIDQTLFDAARAAGTEQRGILLDQNAADVAAWNGLPAAPLAPGASFTPLKPIKQQGPSGLALAGSLIGNAASSVGTGISTYRTLKG